MSNLQLFAFNNQSIRVVTIKGEPWFVAKDVCQVLTIANIGDALGRLDSDEKDELTGESLIGLTDDLNTVRLSVISESGLYSLTLSSRKPQAKEFKRWVTHEVLPAIRKTGKYEIKSQFTPSLPQDYEEAVVALLGQIREKKALAAANQQLEQEKQELTTAIAIVKPKAEFYDIYVSRDGWLTGEQIAKQLSVSTRKMFDVLRGEKVIYYRSGKNFPCADWVNKGWATMRPVRCHDEIMRNNLVFSHKVIMQIFDLLQNKGLIDKDRQYNIHFQTDEPRRLKMA
jgi:prophage antirepressor-like protein